MIRNKRMKELEEQGFFTARIIEKMRDGTHTALNALKHFETTNSSSTLIYSRDVSRVDLVAVQEKTTKIKRLIV
jgi:hypothetical protein